MRIKINGSPIENFNPKNKLLNGLLCEPGTNETRVVLIEILEVSTRAKDLKWKIFQAKFEKKNVMSIDTCNKETTLARRVDLVLNTTKLNPTKNRVLKLHKFYVYLIYYPQINDNELRQIKD
uniref:Uncharacterized protein n=1 Tax=Romanomermis culicivorax TaxID=13658 RepID=A0A915KD22_ROMCU